jgi:hypothetical protein
MNSDDKTVDREMLLAEFAALRAQISQRVSMQWNIFALQLAAAGVVFSFALSNPSHTGFLLILPVITYALSGRYVSQYFGIQTAAQYIREELEVRAKGKLHWEAWNRVQPPKVPTLNWLNPLLLVFPGPAVVALAWVAPYVWASHNTSGGKRVLIVMIWLVGALVTALSIHLITRILSKHWHRSWRQRVNEHAALNNNPDNVISAETTPGRGKTGDQNPPAPGQEAEA